MSWAVLGTDAHAQVFNCDSGRSVGKQFQMIMSSINPASMNFRFSNILSNSRDDNVF